MTNQSKFMNAQILAASGREDGDMPRKQEPSGMNRQVVDSIPKSYDLFKKIDIFKKDE